MNDWGFSVVLYFFVAGIAGGAYFTSAMIELFGSEEDKKIADIGYKITLPMVIIGVIALIADLGSPLRFMHMMGTLKFLSPMSMGSWALLAFGFFSLVSNILIWGDEPKHKGTAVETTANAVKSIFSREIIAAIGAPIGIFLAGYTGVLLGTTNLPLWGESRLLGALFFVSGVSTAIAAMWIIIERKGIAAPATFEKLKKIDNIAIILELVILILFLVALASASPESKKAVIRLITGTYGVLFWLGVVLIGLLAPLAVQIKEALGKAAEAKMTLVIAVMILFGGFLLRFVIIYAGQV